ncbi:MAG: aryl-sulfate sulfotransferase [Gemmatimonadota bacterium]
MESGRQGGSDGAERSWARGGVTVVVFSAVAAVGACTDWTTAPERAALEELPTDLAAVTFEAEGRPTVPYVLLELSHAEGFRGYVAVNGEGRPVWYFRTEGGPVGAARRRNGNFVFVDHERGLLEVTVDGDVVHELPHDEESGRYAHHDVTATSRNTLLFIAKDTRPWEDGEITGDAIWEWDPEADAVVRRWSAFDHLDPAVDWGPRSRPGDWLHANSLTIGPRGNVVLSLHFLDQVLSIEPDFGGLEWRLGGTGATIPVDDPFSGQHTAAEVRPNRVLLFDNGFAREEERYSRAAEYELREGMAHKVWEWRPERDNWARIISSAMRLPNGNTMVAFGTGDGVGPLVTGPIEVYEVTRAGAVLWHLELGGEVTAMYRATPLFDL